MTYEILLVDNNPGDLSRISELLSSKNYEVVPAGRAEEAVELFNTRRFPVVLTANELPGMSGIDLLKHIKHIDKTSQVIIMTGISPLETSLSALRAGAYDSLIKPLPDPGQVATIVAQAFDKRRTIEENQLLIREMKINNDKLEQANKCLIEMAIRDGLTGLYNHRFFQECHQTEVARSRRHNRAYSLIFIDIDHFKEYNDTHGHVEGDKLLRLIAQMLKGRIRQSDFAYRYGGEEFALLLPETEKEGAHIVAESIRQRIAEYPFKGRESQPFGKVTISAGITTFPEDGAETEDILNKADQAMYLAKKNGRNNVYVFNKDVIQTRTTSVV